MLRRESVAARLADAVCLVHDQHVDLVVLGVHEGIEVLELLGRLWVDDLAHVLGGSRWNRWRGVYCSPVLINSRL